MNRISKIAIREFSRIVKIPYMRAIYFIAPLIIFAIFSGIYSKQFVNDIPITIYDEDHSQLSRVVSSFLESSPFVSVESYSSSVEEIKENMISNSVHGAIHIPQDFEKDIKKGKQVTVDIYRDGAGILYAGLLQKALSEIVLTVNGGVILQRSLMLGNGGDFSTIFANPIRVQKSILYNSTYNYSNYLVPGLTTVTIQMILVMVAVFIINSEFVDKSFKELMSISNNSAIRIFVGKLIAHYTVSLYLLLFLFVIVFGIMRTPFRGNLFSLITLYSLFSMASISMGMMLSSYIKEQLLVGDVALFYTAPAFVFSGYTFPLWALPWFDQLYSKIIPYTFFSEGFFQLYQQGVAFSTISNKFLPLLAFIIIGSVSSIVGIQKLIKDEVEING